VIASLAARFQRLPRGARTAVLMIMTTMVISLMHVIIRYTTQQLHPFEVAFFRNFFGLTVLVPILWRNGLGVLRTRRLPLHMTRSAFQFVSMVTFFFGLSVVPLAKASALRFTSPLFVTIFAALLLGEAIRLRRIGAVAVGFVGMLVIVRPSAETIEAGTVLIIISSATLAGMYLCIKKLSATESSIVITAYGASMLTVLSIVPSLFVWQWPTLEQFILMFAMGALGSLAHVTTASVLKSAEASEIVPYDFTRLVWASILGFALFGEIPTWATLAGGLIIIASSSYIAYREAQLSPKRGARPKPAVGVD